MPIATINAPTMADAEWQTRIDLAALYHMHHLAEAAGEGGRREGLVTEDHAVLQPDLPDARDDVVRHLARQVHPVDPGAERIGDQLDAR